MRYALVALSLCLFAAPAFAQTVTPSDASSTATDPAASVGSEGALDVAPGASPTRGLRMRLRATQPGVTFHAMPADGFERLCAAPCEATLALGTRLGLSLDSGDPIAAPSLEFTRGGTLVGDYTDNHSIRIIGWLTLGLGVAVGATLMLLPVFGVSAIDSDARYVYVGVGAGVALLTAITGGVLAFLPDQALIRFE